LTLLAIFNIASLMKTACICLLIEGIGLTWRNFFFVTRFLKETGHSINCPPLDRKTNSSPGQFTT